MKQLQYWVCLSLTVPVLWAQSPLDGEPLPAEDISTELVEPEVVREPVPERFMDAYFGNRPKSFLIDPQGALHRRDYKEREHFLNYHSSDSAIDLWFYLFKQNQEIPAGVRTEELGERFFSQGRPAAVVFYFMGEPERSEIHLSPSLTGVVPVSERNRALDSSAEQALKDGSPVKQFERYTVQMSVLIYRMELLLEEQEERAKEAQTETISGPANDEQEAKLTPVMRAWSEARPYGWYMVGGVFLLVLLLVVREFHKSRKTYQLLRIDVEPRLGGEHAAGVGAVISFANASLPPAAQKVQAPEHMD